jgi:chromosome segregation ATPase
LAALVPGDLQTARQVAEKIIKDFRALQARVAHLEKDLRKRLTTMENAKAAVEDAKKKQLVAEQKSRTLQTTTKRATHNKKVAEDAAKQFDDKFDVMKASREDLATKVEMLESELEATRDALIATRNEVEVGRKLMLQLVTDEDGEMGHLVSNTEQKILASQSPTQVTA